jgi:DNA-binding transcriptional ArsR family regulator
MDETDVVKALSALAQETRLRIFRLLIVAGRAGLTPGQMSEQLHTPATALSFHLKELSHAGLVAAERDGRNLIYRAHFDRMRGLLGYLTEHCCGGQPCEVAAVDCEACGPSA